MASNTEKRDVIITLQGGQALSTIQDMQVHMRKLRAEFRKTADETKRNKIASEMKKVNNELSKQYALTRASANGFSKLQSTIIKIGGSIGAMMGFQILTDQVGQLIKRGAELSDSMADVQKTTGLTEQQVKDLDKSLRGLDTRTSRKALLELARDAGKLGKDSVADVQKFVEQADKINVALGEDLGQGALVTIGKLSNIFKTDMLKIASSINTVGASSEASEPALVEFLSRLGGIASTAKLSAPDIIGYGATLDALGLKAEMSTTALNTFFIDFIKNSEEFGRVAGFAEGELSKLIGTEGTNAGFVAFLEKLRETHPEQKQFLEALEQIGIDGARGSQVFLTLANNTEMLRKQQDIANDSFEKGTSVIDEFNTKNNNFAANLNRIQKELGRMFVSSSVMDSIEGFVNGVADYMKVPLSRKMHEEQVQMNVLVGRILELNEGNEDRKKLIEELNRSYPQLLQGIDSESASNEMLAGRLKEVNKQLINRIIIQRKQEAIDKKNATAADFQEKMLEYEDKLRNEIAEKALKYKVDLTGINTLEEKRLKVLEAVQAVVNEDWNPYNDDDQNNLVNYATHLQNFTNKYNAALKESNDLTEEQNRLRKEFGLLDESPSDNQDPLGLNAEFNSIMAGMNALIAVRDQSSKELSEKEKQRISELAKHSKELFKQLQDAKLDAIEDVEQRSIAAAKLEYERRKEEIESTEANEEVKNDLLEQLYRNFLHEKAVIHAEATQKRIEEEARQVELANDSELLTLQLRVDVAEENSMEQLDAYAALLQRQMEIELDNENLSVEQKELIQRDYINRLNSAWDDYYDWLKNKGEEHKTWEQMDTQERAAAISGYLDQIESLWNSMTDAISNMYSQQLQEAEHQQQAQLAQAEEDLQNGVITQEEFEQRKFEIKERFQEKERSLKRAQFETERAAAIGQGMISIAQGILVAIEQGGPLAAFTAALVTAMGIAQIAAISNEPNPYYAGGLTGIRDSEGNRHMARNVGSLAGGGYYSTPSYGVVAERGPELVIPNWLLNAPEFSNPIAELEGAIARGYATGGRTSATASQAPSFGNASSTSAQSGRTDAAFMALLANTNALLSDLKHNGIRATALWDFQKYLDGVMIMEDIDNKKYLVGDEGRKPGQKF